MRSSTFVALAVVFCALAAPAQESSEALQKREAELRARAIESLNGHAAECEAAQLYGRARELRQEILIEYDEDDAVARKELGFVRIGEQWRRDADVFVPIKDKDGAKLSRKVDRQWARVARDLGRAHEKLAAAWDAAGDPERARYHVRRLLRFRPGDKAAARKLDLGSFEGFRGTDHDMALLRRSRMIGQVVAFLETHEFAVEELSEEELNPILTKAGIGHVGVKTKHLRIYGNLDPGLLQRMAQYGERSLALCNSVFAAAGAEPWPRQPLRDMVAVRQKETYQGILSACAGQFTPERLKFLKESVELSFVTQPDGTQIRVFFADGEEIALDAAVRNVAQDRTRFATHGLWEGIGHATTGLFFGQTLAFLVEQRQERTVSGVASRMLVPDIEVWQAIAADTAWTKTDTPTSRLVLLHASRFTTEERVKAWSMVDYLLRWRPELLFGLDATKSDAVKSPPDVEGAFRQGTGVDLRRLDHEWRRYWAEGEKLRAAMAAPPDDLEVAEAADQWLAAIHRLRLGQELGLWGWYLPDDDELEGVHRYFRELAKAEKAQEKAKGKGREVTLPTAPPALEARFLATRSGDPVEAVATWLAEPRTRDVLLHPGRYLVGFSRGRDAVLLDLAEPEWQPEHSRPTPYPGDGQESVPRGEPLTLHFHRPLRPAEASHIGCSVVADGTTVPGDLTTVPDRDGLFAFSPRDPLPSAALVTVTWHVPAGLLPGEDEAMAPVRFRVE